MKDLIRQFNDLSRREFVTSAARAFLGVNVLSLAGPGVAAALAAPSRSRKKPTSKNVIYLYMAGGMSHLDTFDPKPKSETQGPVEAIKTKADGVLISEYLPGLATHMDKIAVIRSMFSTQGAHDQGQYFLHTSYIARGTIQHPSLSSWVLNLSGRTNEQLPGNVLIGGAGRSVGAGFFETRFAPVVIGNPYAGLQHSRLPKGVDERRFRERLSLASRFDKAFQRRYDQQQVRAYTDMYDDAIGLMKSKDLEAFDINHEKPALREAYGQNPFGQGCLLARRLVQKRVRFVEVTLGGWDTHTDNFVNTSRLSATLDQALSTLLTDLKSKGLLDQTLVVVATEFGRTPVINENNGRDHHNKAFACLLAGGGVKGGQAYGGTDPRGVEIEDNEVTIPDFNATIIEAIGLPLHKVIHSPEGRPFTVAHKGKPIEALLGG